MSRMQRLFQASMTVLWMFGYCLVPYVAEVSVVTAYAAEISGVEDHEKEQLSVYQVENRLENDRQILSAAKQCLRSGEQSGGFEVIGRNYMPEGSILKVFYGDQVEYSSTCLEKWAEGDVICQRVRFGVTWEDEKQPEEDTDEEPPDAGMPDKRYWQLGDVVEREIAGKRYSFRCIDQHYQNAALFLCDSVFPADTEASYQYEKQEDGSYDYRYLPGPIQTFGPTSAYKDSYIRQWLDQKVGEDWVLPEAAIGISYGYFGQTKQGAFAQLDEADLTAGFLGYQKLRGQLFVLSVEEALLYRQYLWRFGVGTDAEENPETQILGSCTGYWLRTPYIGTGFEELQEDAVYLVDLIDGVIRSQPISGENAVTSVGVRPAFVLQQYE